MRTLKRVDFLILLVLADGELHGYGIVKEIERRTNGGVRLEPGNLYRYIRKLVEEGWVEPAERRAAHGDERRRYYRVTPEGRESLRLEAARMKALAADADEALAR